MTIERGRRRSAREGRTPLSIILALVLPAMIAAALALAFFGYRYVDDVQSLISGEFHRAAQLAAGRIFVDLETRVDGTAKALFRAVERAVEDPVAGRPCEVPLDRAILSFALFDRDRQLHCAQPPTRELPAEYAGALAWDTVPVGGFRYVHRPLESRSLLLALTARETDDGEPYYVAARLNLDVVVGWLREAIDDHGEGRRVTVRDERGQLVAGTTDDGAIHDRDPFVFANSLGKVLYSWRLQIAPADIAAFRAQAERRRRIEPLLIVLSVIIIAVGLAIVVLVVLAERRSGRLRSEFIANVSHELKTPLSLVRMFGEMIATGKHKGEDAAREYGGIIMRESDRLAHLIDNVLDFSRLERGKASYAFAPRDLGEVTERALDVCRARVEKESMTLSSSVAPGLPPVRLDENAVTLLILNLVDNAIKYAAAGGAIDVRLERVGDGGVALSVRDFGPGIPREEHARIFERFYRTREAREGNVRGSGIGLALVEHIVAAHGARVVVESPVPGAPPERPGARFRIEWPAA